MINELNCSPQRAFTFLSWYPSHGRHAKHRHHINKEQDTSLCPLRIALNVIWVESKPLPRMQSASAWYWHLRCTRHHYFITDCIFVSKPPLALRLGCTEYLLFEPPSMDTSTRHLHVSSWVKQNHRITEAGWGIWVFCACSSSGPGSCSKQAP